MKVLFRMNMTAVAHHAHFFPQNNICPMSQTSRTSGCLKQNSHRTSELYRSVSMSCSLWRGTYVYSTINAWTTVKMRLIMLLVKPPAKRWPKAKKAYPGTSPRILYDQGKLMMA